MLILSSIVSTKRNPTVLRIFCSSLKSTKTRKRRMMAEKTKEKKEEKTLRKQKLRYWSIVYFGTIWKKLLSTCNQLCLQHNAMSAKYALTVSLNWCTIIYYYCYYLQGWQHVSQCVATHYINSPKICQQKFANRT